ncbi:MAG: hypothetical protein KatS3mg110_2786 [Pirellulaceae bacterium]|nr:MAG: hypothetical protein KatS3mg110_2786 [Pirellulaceae bacterium]
MQISSIAADRLEVFPEISQAWQELRSARPEYASPHVALEYVRMVAAVRPAVEIAVLRDAAGVAALLPFLRSKNGRAEPIAGTFSDLEGGVYRNDCRLRPRELLQRLGLRAWSYRRWLACQEPFARWAAGRLSNPIIDLREGWAAYYQQIRARRSEVIKRAEQKRRKIVRELGTVRFEPDLPDVGLLRQALAWKADWVRSKGMYNPIGEPWHGPLLETLIHYRRDTFRGRMACLFVGSRPVAVMVMIQDGPVAAFWFGAFCPELASFSPGLVCDYELLRSSADLGIERIELGCGTERYKQQLGNDSIPVVEGMLLPTVTGAACYRQWLKVKEHLRSRPWAAPLRRAVWAARNVRAQLRALRRCLVTKSTDVPQTLGNTESGENLPHNEMVPRSLQPLVLRGAASQDARPDINPSNYPATVEPQP